MRPPSILDVVRAVTVVAPAYTQVATWWYSPATRFRLRGEGNGAGQERAPLKIAIDLNGDRNPDFDGIAAALAGRLGVPVAVRAHQGSDEQIRLVRVLTVQQR
ncbi:MAG: hypothetical protein GTO22_01220 [Gemmatimonadales bacterium]|nr:hypothetical protein [Gemmatimonadales bacterium]